MTIRRASLHAFTFSTLVLSLGCGGHVDSTPVPEKLVDINACAAAPNGPNANGNAANALPRVVAELDPAGSAYVAGSIANDGDHLFVLGEGVHPEDSTLLAIAKAGGAAVTLAAAPFATHVVAAGDYAYFTNANDGGLFRVRKDGAAPSARFAPEGSARWQTATPTALTRDGGALYFAYRDAKGTSISKIDGAAGSVVWTSAVEGVVQDIALSRGEMWFVRSSSELVHATAAADGTLTQTVIAKDSAGIGGVAIDGGVVYFASGGSIRALGTADSATVIAEGQDHPSRIFVDDANVYWLNAGHLEGTCGLAAFPGASVPCRVVGAGVMRAPRKGGAAELFTATPEGEAFVRDATEDVCSLYWTSNGRVLSRAK